VEGHEGEHAGRFAGQQQPARGRLGQQHRRRRRPQELGQEAARPQHQQQHAQAAGPGQRQHRLQEDDRRLGVARHRRPDQPERQADAPLAAVEAGERLLVRPVQLDLALRLVRRRPLDADAQAQHHSQAAQAQQQPAAARRQRLADGVPEETPEDVHGRGGVHGASPVGGR
jgi:hypothetical protein